MARKFEHGKSERTYKTKASNLRNAASEERAKALGGMFRDLMTIFSRLLRFFGKSGLAQLVR